MANKQSNLIQTIKNIWGVEDLRVRIGITLLLITVYRFGSQIVLPGIDPGKLAALSSQTEGGLMSLLDMFSGGAFSNASIFALGIMPYISASIVVQLAQMVVPALKKMQSEGESGRRKLNQYTRYLTILILLVQAPTYIANIVANSGVALTPVVSNNLVMFYITSTIILAGGSMFILWLGERITDKGLGNGVSIIIMIGIIARLPMAIVQEFTSRMTNIAGGGIIMFLIEIVLMIFVICAAIALLGGTRRIRVQYAKQVAGGAVRGANQYIPLKVNAANVMPIIFAQAIMFIPILFMRGNTDPSDFLISMMDYTSVTYNLVFASLIIAFTYFYVAISFNPNQMAEDLKRNNGFIPGVKPGKATAEYIDTIMSRLTLPGSVFLAIVAVLPAVVSSFFGTQAQFAAFFGGTSLLILVGVILDTLRQIEGYLTSRHYNGLLSTGRIRGRAE